LPSVIEQTDGSGAKKSLVHPASSFSDLSDRSVWSDSLDKAFILVSPALLLLHMLAEGCRTSASTNVYVFSRHLGGTKEDLYLGLILILIFVLLEERRTPSVPLAEATYLKL